MQGMNRETGAYLSGIDHLKQSLGDLLNTRIGTRVLLRSYGCKAVEMIDSPLNSETVLDFYQAIYDAISAWEPRLNLKKIEITSVTAGAIVIDLYGIYLPDGTAVTVSGVKIS